MPPRGPKRSPTPKPTPSDRAGCVRENEDLARVISGQVRKLPGITSSETLISFKVYSKKDLDAGFALGLD